MDDSAKRPLKLSVSLIILSALAAAAPSFVYVGPTQSRSVLIAWGTTQGGGRNTIGRASNPMGNALLRLNGDHPVTGRNWYEVTGLAPDTAYPYEVLIDGKRIGGGTVRTLPERAATLNFFVIGDYGTGGLDQLQVARTMWTEFQRLEAAGKHPRFVITNGDNIYAKKLFGVPTRRGSGSDDAHWESRFFLPYKPLIERIPFYPTLGNHDGNESESTRDLPVYLDNFFFPGNTPARYYTFSVSGLADFFALDTTRNVSHDSPVPGMDTRSTQYQWLKKELAASSAPWKIAYGHHPPFTAGPEHPAAYQDLLPFMNLFRDNRVAAYFCGHEHNFQLSAAHAEMGKALMVLSGAGGELRAGGVRDHMRSAGIAAWAGTVHFLSVEIEGDEMRIMPLSPYPFHAVDPDGHEVKLPIVIRKP
ncbi:metallophosphoesterase [uncultured Paludibaculum sp.]|uniref:metallophosphoesterase n=1 Tax=uncultured Paludibaculum sp. TaxID=1765020 RepID=UPI002AABDF53|nr:metallophosphoesterase [uncultured Paludibaculum sp.]